MRGGATAIRRGLLSVCLVAGLFLTANAPAAQSAPEGMKRVPIDDFTAADMAAFRMISAFSEICSHDDPADAKGAVFAAGYASAQMGRALSAGERAHYRYLEGIVRSLFGGLNAVRNVSASMSAEALRPVVLHVQKPASNRTFSFADAAFALRDASGAQTRFTLSVCLKRIKRDKALDARIKEKFGLDKVGVQPEDFAKVYLRLWGGYLQQLKRPNSLMQIISYERTDSLNEFCKMTFEIHHLDGEILMARSVYMAKTRDPAMSCVFLPLR